MPVTVVYSVSTRHPATGIEVTQVAVPDAGAGWSRRRPISSTRAVS